MGTDTRGVSWSAALRAALDRSGEISYSSMFQIKVQHNRIEDSSANSAENEEFIVRAKY
jgi:hypothetical protein